MRKKVISLFVVLAMCFAMLPMSAIAANTPAGTGTEKDPYKIASAADLIWLSDYVNGNAYNMEEIYVEQMADIDLNPGYVFNEDGSYTGGSAPYKWTPIGNVCRSLSEYIKPFVGHYDGKGYTIRGLYINQPLPASSDDITDMANGLFGYADSSTISNVTIENSYINSQNVATGSIVGIMALCTVENCHSSAYLKSSAEYGQLGGLGGIIGQMNGIGNKLMKCTFTGSVEHNGTYPYVGGIVGKNQCGYIADCINYGDVTSIMDKVGGIIGLNYIADPDWDGEPIPGETNMILRCANYGNITSTNGAVDSSTGGIIGACEWGEAWSSIIRDCLNMGTVKANMAGGIVGYLGNENVTIENCYNGGDVSQGPDSGGLVGRHLSSNTAKNSYFLQTDTINAGIDAAGVLGSSNGGGNRVPTEQELIKDAAVSAEKAASGELTYLLNTNQSELVWRQNLDNGQPVDAHPALKGGKVYYVKKYTTCGKKDQPILMYTNVDGDRVPAHQFEWVVDREATTSKEGLKHQKCKVCGAVQSQNTVIPKLKVSPNTGDTSMNMVYILVGAVCLLALAGFREKRRYN